MLALAFPIYHYKIYAYSRESTLKLGAYFGLIAIIIHCTINKKTLFHFKKEDSNKLSVTHRKFLATVLFYFIL